MGAPKAAIKRKAFSQPILIKTIQPATPAAAPHDTKSLLSLQKMKIYYNDIHSFERQLFELKATNHMTYLSSRK